MRRLKTAASSSVHGKDVGLLRAGISLETSRSLEVLSKRTYQKHSLSYSNVKHYTIYTTFDCLLKRNVSRQKGTESRFCFVVVVFFNKDVFLKNI